MIVFKPPLFYTHNCSWLHLMAHLIKDTSPRSSPVDTISVDVSRWCCLLCNPLPLLLFSHALFMSIFQLFKLFTLVVLVLFLFGVCFLFSLIFMCCVLFYVLCIEVVSLMVRLLVFTECFRHVILSRIRELSRIRWPNVSFL